MKVNRASTFQFFDVRARGRSPRLHSSPASLGQHRHRTGRGRRRSPLFGVNLSAQRADRHLDMHTRLAGRLGLGPLGRTCTHARTVGRDRSTEDHLDGTRAVKGLSVSNLAWGGAVEPARCNWLKDLGVQGIEIAPTALTCGTWPTPSEIRALLATMASTELRVSGSAITSVRPPRALPVRPGTWPDLTLRLTACAELAAELGADVLVFGSPRNRLRGSRGTPEAIDTATEYFTSLIP